MKISFKLLAASLALQAAAAQAAPNISADNDAVVIPAGQKVGSAIIAWDAEKIKKAEVWVQVDGGAETRFSGDKKGSKTAAIRIGKKYVFKLYDAKPFFGPLRNSTVRVLDSVEVRATRSGSDVQSARLPDRTPTGTVVPAEWPGGVKFPAPAPPTDARYAPSYIYALRPDGLLGWYRHDGAPVGTFKWEAPRLVERNFADYKQVFAGGGGDIYTVSQDGILELHRHIGFATGLNMDNANGWQAAQTLGNGWGNYKQAFAGGDGVIYVIAQSGALLWYKNTPAGLQGPKEIGDSWANFKRVFSAGQGIIYALTKDGKMLWYKHTGHADGAKTWLPSQVIATDMSQFDQVFGAGMFTTGNPAVDGATMYFVTTDGKLMWRKHRGFRDGSDTWSARREVGSGWNNFQTIFALLSTTPADQSSVFNPNAPKTLNLNPYIKNVQVRPGVRDVKISFSNSLNNIAVVEIDDVAPARDRFGVLKFPDSSGAFSRLVKGENGRYNLDLSVAADQLEPNRTYHFVIKVLNDAATDPKRKIDQFTGKFTTQNQTVRIVWESVHISNDSDPNGAGEISFEFFMNYGTDSARTFQNSGKLPDGRNHPLNKTIVINQAPDILSLAVNGEDDDRTSSFRSDAGKPLSGPHMTDDYEQNVAKSEIDLSQFPGKDVRVPFELRSMPNGGDKGDLQFEAKGIIFITRG